MFSQEAHPPRWHEVRRLQDLGLRYLKQIYGDDSIHTFDHFVRKAFLTPPLDGDLIELDDNLDGPSLIGKDELKNALNVLTDAADRVRQALQRGLLDGKDEVELRRGPANLACESLNSNPPPKPETEGNPLTPSNGEATQQQMSGPPTAVARTESKGRKRGPKPDHKTFARVREIVDRIAPDGDWRSKLDALGEALDHGVCNDPDPEACPATDHDKIPFPRGWSREKGGNWSHPPDRATMVKAIEYRLEAARKKPINETLS
jgi:hypothetical protein